mmetsp:Transcript_12131/g.32106  ORF Transcript_12131/g.32106 Transcript_12131/m.32106 type:complete len:231 (+) Transcript_12131:96-788(+)
MPWIGHGTTSRWQSWSTAPLDDLASPPASSNASPTSTAAPVRCPWRPPRRAAPWTRCLTMWPSGCGSRGTGASGRSRRSTWGACTFTMSSSASTARPAVSSLQSCAPWGKNSHHTSWSWVTSAPTLSCGGRSHQSRLGSRIGGQRLTRVMTSGRPRRRRPEMTRWRSGTPCPRTSRSSSSRGMLWWRSRWPTLTPPRASATATASVETRMRPCCPSTSRGLCDSSWTHTR